MTFTTSASRTRATARFASLGIAAALLLTGCSAAAGGTEASEPVYGGDLIHLAAEAQTNFHWTEASHWENAAIIINLVDNLVAWDSQSVDVRPWLAESWDVNDDSTEFTFVLREGVTFSDGTALDAQIVADNIDLQATGDEARGIIRSTAYPTSYDRTEVVDDRTVKVYFTSPAASFLRGLTYHTTGIVGRSTLEASKEDGAQLKNLVGSGPFVLESEKAGEEYVLAKREGYDWAPEGAGHQGEAYLDSVTIQVVPEDSVRAGALEAGQAHTLRNIQPADEENLEAAGIEIFASIPPGEPLGLTVRTDSVATGDVRVRQAVQHGINRQEIVDTLYYTDRWVAASSALQPSTPGYVDLSSQLDYDPELSNKLLDEAGWDERDSEGYRVKDGERLWFPVYPSSAYQLAQPELELIAQQLKQIGIEFEVRLVDPSGYAAAIAEPETSFQITQLTVADVGGRWRTKWDSTLALDSASSSNVNVGDEKIDALFAQINASANEDERVEPIADIQKQIIEQAYLIPLEVNQQLFGLAESVHGFNTTAFARPIFYDVWLDEE